MFDRLFKQYLRNKHFEQIIEKHQDTSKLF